MRNLRILGEMLENAEILKDLQYHIKDKRLPISLKDDLNKQVARLKNILVKLSLKNLSLRKIRSMSGQGFLLFLY